MFSIVQLLLVLIQGLPGTVPGIILYQVPVARRRIDRGGGPRDNDSYILVWYSHVFDIRICITRLVYLIY